MLQTFDLNKQYVKFPEIKREEVQKFTQWIKDQPHIADLPEEEALLFYYSCKFSLEFSKQVLDSYLTCRTHVEELFGNLDIESPSLKRPLQILSVCPIPKLTAEGHGVFMAKLIDFNTSNFNFAECIKLLCLTMDMWLREVGLLPGIIVVIDLKGVTLGHVGRLGILTMKKFLYYLQEAIPIRMSGFHFINQVPFMDKILALMTPFMKKELQNILQIHSSMETFYPHVPKDMLPHENGGYLEESKDLREIFYDKLRQSRKEILEFEQNHRVVEKLRPGKAKNASDLFGIEGNFKKLDID